VRANAEQVERAATFAGLAQRPPLSPDEARAMLGVKDRRRAAAESATKDAAASGTGAR